MSAVSKPKLTEAEYLIRETAAAFKSEFYKGEMFAMAGASYDHTAINDILVYRLSAALEGSPCRTLSRDMRVKVEATGLLTYPDALIVCGPPLLMMGRRDVLLNPSVIFEVLSDSTARYDRGEKFRNYKQIPSLNEYILIAEDEPVCERFVRRPDGEWPHADFVGLDAELVLATVPARVKLADLYAGVTFPEASP